MADIFEVRGYPRPARGELRPIELTGDRVVFAYDGLDGRRRGNVGHVSKMMVVSDRDRC